MKPNTSVATLLCCCIFLTATTHASGAEISGEVEVQVQHFYQKSTDSQQSDSYPSVAANIEYFHDFDDGKQRIVANLFSRVDKDSKRTHSDARELYWRKTIPQHDLDLYIGARKVFWGVTESVHLVDIINQTDLVENIDGEQKFGQPMLQATVEKNWGTTHLFIMPYFRERSFAGEDARLRGFLITRGDNAQYESSKKRKHIDLAARWEHVIGDADIGIHYFQGTDRDPVNLLELEPNIAANTIDASLIPRYDQVRRVGIDAQYTKGPWLLKLEAINRDKKSDIGNSQAAVTGVEYTLYNVNNKGLDIGLIGEYQYDNQSYRVFDPKNASALIQSIIIRNPSLLNQVPGAQGKIATTSADNDFVLGARMAFNDTQDSRILALMTIDDTNGSKFYSLEAQRRINQNWSASLQARVFSDTADDELAFYIRNDDYIDLRLVRYFD